MKKILFILCFLISQKGFSQLSGTSVIQLTGGDWSYVVGSLPAQDSSNIILIKRISDTVKAVGGNFNTQVRFTGIPNQFLYDVYVSYKNITVNLYEQVGTNLGTQIKAVSNTPLQTAITAFDNGTLPVYKTIRSRGKNILVD